MEKTVKVGREPITEADQQQRVAAIRATLPVQVEALWKVERRQRVLERRQRAEAEFGLSYTKAEIIRRVKRTLPLRLFRGRYVRLTFIEFYPDPIPDAALLRYKAALESGLFSSFTVADVAYEDRRGDPADPWLLGEVGERYIVLAYWE